MEPTANALPGPDRPHRSAPPPPLSPSHAWNTGQVYRGSQSGPPDPNNCRQCSRGLNRSVNLWWTGTTSGCAIPWGHPGGSDCDERDASARAAPTLEPKTRSVLGPRRLARYTPTTRAHVPTPEPGTNIMLARTLGMQHHSCLVGSDYNDDTCIYWIDGAHWPRRAHASLPPVTDKTRGET